MKIRKFNEDYEFDYSSWIKPITKESIIEGIIESLSEIYEFDKSELDKEDVKKWLDKTANEVMYSMQQQLSYFNDEHEDKVEEFLNLINY